MKHYGKLIKSDNALRAEDQGRYPITEGTRQLQNRLKDRGIKATLARCRAALEQFGYDGEWHHVSKFANEIDYFDVENVLQMLDQENTREQLLKALSQNSEKADSPVEIHALIEWTEWLPTRTKWKKSRERRFVGKAIVKGDWIRFDGKRKKLSGNCIAVTQLSQDECARLSKEEEIARKPFEEIEKTVLNMRASVTHELWGIRKRNPGEANARLRSILSLRTRDKQYRQKLKFGWQVLEDTIRGA